MILEFWIYIDWINNILHGMMIQIIFTVENINSNDILYIYIMFINDHYYTLSCAFYNKSKKLIEELPVGRLRKPIAVKA